MVLVICPKEKRLYDSCFLVTDCQDDYGYAQVCALDKYGESIFDYMINGSAVYVGSLIDDKWYGYAEDRVER